MIFVTAKKGKNHVTSQQFRQIVAAMAGTESYIADMDEHLEPELAANNTIKIRSGTLIHHGGVMMVKSGTYDEVTYQNGSQGMKRIDLVAARYTKDQATGTENAEWVVIQGQPAESNPVAPDYIHGNMQDGDITDDCPIFELHFDGINVTEVKKLINVMQSVDELNRNFVFKRRNSSEAGICTPHYIMIMGTSVLQGANADYRQLFLASDLLSKLKFYDPSISNFEAAKCVITTNNGDGNAAAIHFYAPEWWGSNNAYFQYFYPATSSTIRVNYCIHYLKL